MNDEINRVKRDLEVMRTAVGFGGAPVGNEDVLACRFLGMVGIVWAIAAWAAGGWSYPTLTKLGLIVSVVGMVLYHFSSIRNRERNACRDRAYRSSWWLSLLLGGLIGGFYVWAKFIAQLGSTTFLGASLVFAGALVVLLAVTDKWRLSLLAWALPLLLFGYLAPSMNQAEFGISCGAFLSFGGLVSSGILSRQLRESRTPVVDA